MRNVTIKIILATVLISTAAFVSAADGVKYDILQPLPGVGKQVSSFPEYIQNIIPFLLSLAAVAAVVMIVIGGIQYAISEAVGQKEDAKDRITQAILGLLLALVSYLILYTINPQLVNLQLDIKPLQPTAEIKLCKPECKIGTEICVDGTCEPL